MAMKLKGCLRVVFSMVYLRITVCEVLIGRLTPPKLIGQGIFYNYFKYSAPINSTRMNGAFTPEFIPNAMVCLK